VMRFGVLSAGVLLLAATVISMTNLDDSAGEWGGVPALGLLGTVFGIRTASAVALAPAFLLDGRG